MSAIAVEWLQALAPMGIVGSLVWWMFARLMDEVKQLKIDVGAMAVKNAEDHGDVQAKIAALEERVEAMRSPWNRAAN